MKKIVTPIFLLCILLFFGCSTEKNSENPTTASLWGPNATESAAAIGEIGGTDSRTMGLEAIAQGNDSITAKIIYKNKGDFQLVVSSPNSDLMSLKGSLIINPIATNEQGLYTYDISRKFDSPQNNITETFSLDITGISKMKISFSPDLLASTFSGEINLEEKQVMEVSIIK